MEQSISNLEQNLINAQTGGLDDYSGLNENTGDTRSIEERIVDTFNSVRELNKTPSSSFGFNDSVDEYETDTSNADRLQRYYGGHESESWRSHNWFQDAWNAFLKQRNEILQLECQNNVMRANEEVKKLEKSLSDLIAYRDQLASTGEDTSEIDKKLNQAQADLNEAKENFNKYTEESAKIKQSQLDRDKKYRTSAWYQAMQEEIEQDDKDQYGWTNIDYLKYFIPGTAGSSYATVEAQAEQMAFQVVWPWAKKHAASWLAQGAVGAAVGSAAGGVGAAPGAVVGGGRAMLKDVALNLIPMAVNVYTNYVARSAESAAEQFSAYEEGLKQKLAEKGIPLEGYLESARNKVAEMHPDWDMSDVSDDYVMQMLASGMLPEVTADQFTGDNSLFEQTASEAYAPTSEIYDRNMLMMGMDVAESSIIYNNMNIFGIGQRALGKLGGAVGKTKVGQKVATSAAAEKARKIQKNVIQPAVDWETKLNRSPWTRVGKDVVTGTARVIPSAIGEAFEEANQDILQWQYLHGEFDDSDANWLDRAADLYISDNWRSAGLLAGNLFNMDVDDELADDEQFYKDAEAGFALGLLMGGGGHFIGGGAANTVADWKSSRIVQKRILDHLSDTEKEKRLQMYANLAGSKLNYLEGLQGALKGWMTSAPSESSDQSLDNIGFTREQLQKELDYVNDIFVRSNMSENQKIRKGMKDLEGKTPKKRSEMYNKFIAKQRMSYDEYEDSKKEEKKAQDELDKYWDGVLTSVANDNHVGPAWKNLDVNQKRMIVSLAVQKADSQIQKGNIDRNEKIINTLNELLREKKTVQELFEKSENDLNEADKRTRQGIKDETFQKDEYKNLSDEEKEAKFAEDLESNKREIEYLNKSIEKGNKILAQQKKQKETDEKNLAAAKEQFRKLKDGENTDITYITEQEEALLAKENPKTAKEKREKIKQERQQQVKSQIDNILAMLDAVEQKYTPDFDGLHAIANVRETATRRREEAEKNYREWCGMIERTEENKSKVKKTGWLHDLLKRLKLTPVEDFENESNESFETKLSRDLTQPQTVEQQANQAGAEAAQNAQNTIDQASQNAEQSVMPEVETAREAEQTTTSDTRPYSKAYYTFGQQTEEEQKKTIANIEAKLKRIFEQEERSERNREENARQDVTPTETSTDTRKTLPPTDTNDTGDTGIVIGTNKIDPSFLDLVEDDNATSEQHQVCETIYNGEGAHEFANLLFYDKEGTEPMLDGYETGQALQEVVNNSNFFNDCEFIIDTESNYYKERDEDEKFNANDENTFDNAIIILSINYKGKKYAMALKEPDAAEVSIRNYARKRFADTWANKTEEEQNAVFQSEEFKREVEDQKTKLRELRKKIILSKREHPEGKVVPQVKQSVGELNVLRNEDGTVKQRSIKDVKSLISDVNDLEDVQFGIGSGVRDQQHPFIITGKHGEQYKGVGGSGQLYIIKNGVPIKLNLHRFSEEEAEDIVKKVANLGAASNPLLDLFVFRGKETKVFGSQYPFLAKKQFYVENGYLHIGTNMYSIKDLKDNETTRKDAAQKMVELGFHVRVDKDHFWSPLSEAIKWPTNTDAITFGGITITKEDIQSNKTIMQFMIEHDLINTDVADEVFTNKWNYVDDITVTYPEDNSVNPTPVAEKKITYDSVVTAAEKLLTQIEEKGGIETFEPCNVCIYIRKVRANLDEVDLSKLTQEQKKKLSTLKTKLTKLKKKSEKLVTDTADKNLEEREKQNEVAEKVVNGSPTIEDLQDILNDTKLEIYTSDNITDLADLLTEDQIKRWQELGKKNKQLIDKIEEKLKAQDNQTQPEETKPPKEEKKPENGQNPPTATNTDDNTINSLYDLLSMPLDNSSNSNSQNINDLPFKTTTAEHARKGSVLTVDKAEINWFHDVLGLPADSLTIVDDAIALGNDKYAMGLVRKDSTVLWKCADKGTLYHEAYHRVSLFLISPKERKRIYEAYRTRHSYYNATDKEVEEALADDFMRYMLNREEPDLNIIKRIWRAIKHFISKWIFRSDATIDNIYERIATKYYRNAKTNSEALQAYLNEYKGESGAPYSMHELTYKKITSDTYRKITNAFVGRLSAIAIASGETTISLNTVKELLNNLRTLYSASGVTQNTKDIIKEIWEKDKLMSLLNSDVLPRLSKLDFKIDSKLRNKNSEEDAELDAALKEELDTKIKQAADGDSVGGSMGALLVDTNTTSAKATATTAVKAFLSTIPLFSKQGDKASIVRTPIGLQQYAEFDTIWNVLLYAFHDTKSFNELLQKARDKANQNNIFYSFYRKLVSISDEAYKNKKETKEQKINRKALQTQILNVFKLTKGNAYAASIAKSRSTKETTGFLYDQYDSKTNNATKNNWNSIFTVSTFNNENLFSLTTDTDGTPIWSLNETKDGKTVLSKFKQEYDEWLIKNGLRVSKSTQQREITLEQIKKGQGIDTEIQYLNKNINEIESQLVGFLNNCGVVIDIATFDEYLQSKFPDYNKTRAILAITRPKMVLSNFMDKVFGLDGNLQSDGKISTDPKAFSVTNFFKYDNFISDLAKAELRAHPSAEEIVVYGADNKLFYAIQEANFLTDTVNDLCSDDAYLSNMNNVTYNAGGEAAKALDSTDEVPGSALLSAITELKKEKNDDEPILQINTVTSFTDSTQHDTARKYEELSPIEDVVIRLTSAFRNRWSIPVMGDSARLNILSGSAINTFSSRKNVVIRYDIPTVELQKAGLRSDAFGGYVREDGTSATEEELKELKKKVILPEEITSRFLKYVATELDTIYNEYENETSNKAQHIKNYDSKRNGFRFRYFENFPLDNNVADLNKELDKLEEDDKTHEKAKEYIQILRDNFIKLATEQSALLNEQMSDYLIQQFEGDLQYLCELGLIQQNEKGFYENNSFNFPRDFYYDTEIEENGWNDAVGSSEFYHNFALLNSLYKFLADTCCSTIEFEKLVVGDPAYFSDTTDKVKRLRGILSTGNTPRPASDFDSKEGMIDDIKAVTLKDNEIASHQVDLIKKFAEKSYLITELTKDGKETIQQAEEEIINGKVSEELKKAAEDYVNSKFSTYFNKMNTADGAVFVSPELYKQFLIRFGDWNDKIAAAFEKLEKINKEGKDVDTNPEVFTADLSVILSPLKLVYYGHHFDANLNRNIPIFDKMAIFPLFECFCSGDMKQLAKTMRIKDIHMAAFESAVKVGRHMNENKGVYSDPETGKLNDYTNLSTHTQHMKYFRKQMVTDPHTANEQMLVSQASKAAMGNIRQSEKYTTSQGTEITGKEIIDTINTCQDELTKKGMKKIEKVLQCDDDGHATEKGVANMLKKKAKARNLDQNLQNGLQIDKNTGTTNVPLFAMSDTSWIESTLINYISEEAIDTQTPGAMLIQVPAISRQNIKAEKYLHFIREEGKLISMEAVASVNLFRNVIPDFKKKSFKEQRQWLLDHNIIGEKATMAAMGYRVPSQGQSSTMPLTIVDVTPTIKGDEIILPDEFVGQTGSDFDIDKLFIARFNYDKNGKKVEWDSTKPANEQTKEALQNKLLDMYLTVLGNPQHFIETRQPLDKVTEKLKNEIVPAIEDGLGISGDKYVGINKTGITFQSSTRNSLAGGKIGIGPFALATSHHVLCQLVNLQFGTQLQNVLSSYNIGPSIGGITSNDGTGINILDYLSALISAHVDVAKDPYIRRLGVCRSSWNMVSFLIRCGKGELTFYFINQPIIRDLINELEMYSGSYGVRGKKNAYSNALKKIWDKYTSEYKGLSNSTEYQKFISDNYGFHLELNGDDASQIFKKDKLVNNLKRNKEKEAEWISQQLKYLAAFDQLTPFARSLTELTTISQIDTEKFGNNFAAEATFLDKWKNYLQNKTTFKNAFDLFQFTFLGQKLLSGLVASRSMLSRVLLQLNPEIEEIRRLSAVLTDNVGNTDTSVVNDINRMINASIKSQFFNELTALSKDEEDAIENAVKDAQAKERIKELDNKTIDEYAEETSDKQKQLKQVKEKINADIQQSSTNPADIKKRNSLIKEIGERKKATKEALKKIKERIRIENLSDNILGSQTTVLQNLNLLNKDKSLAQLRENWRNETDENKKKQIYDRLVKLTNLFNLNQIITSIPNDLIVLLQDIHQNPNKHTELIDSSNQLANTLLKSLKVKTDTNRSDVDNSTFLNFLPERSSINDLKDQMIDDWRALYTSENPEHRYFAIKLAMYAFYTGGDNFGKNNIFNLVPNNLKKDLGFFKKIEDIKENTSSLTKLNVRDIIRNCWWNDSLVEPVEYYQRILDTQTFMPMVRVNDHVKHFNKDSSGSFWEIKTKEGKHAVPKVLFFSESALCHNANQEPIFAPYKKISLTSDFTDVNSIVLYEYTGQVVKQDSEGGSLRYAVYRKVPRTSLNSRGNVLIECGRNQTVLNSYPVFENSPVVTEDGKEKRSSKRNDNLNLLNLEVSKEEVKELIQKNKQLAGFDYTEVNDLTPKQDEFQFFEEKEGTWNIEAIENLKKEQEKKAKEAEKRRQERETRKAGEDPNVVNVWSTSSKYGNLSNFAKRQFTYNGVKYACVEAAFQAAKLEYAKGMSEEAKEKIREKLQGSSITGAEARKIGQSPLKGGGISLTEKEQKEWDNNSSNIMKELIYQSFVENKNALRTLLNTGDKTITHKDPKGKSPTDKWTKEFPKLLMEVRTQIREEIETIKKQREEENKDRSKTWKYKVTVNEVEVPVSVQLNSEQEAALKKIADFIDNEESGIFVLAGYAGTGKTTVMQAVYQYILKKGKQSNVTLSAPTWKALNNLKNSIADNSVNVQTIASLVKCKYNSDTNSFENDNGVIVVNGDKPPIIIVDEASMIKETDKNTIEDVIKIPNAKIIYVGDSFQLPPINESQETIKTEDLESPVFKGKKDASLDTVVRTKNTSITNEATNLRSDQGVLSWKSKETEEGYGIKFETSDDEVKKEIETLFTQNTNNVEQFRIICGLNDQVAAFNKYVHNIRKENDLSNSKVTDNNKNPLNDKTEFLPGDLITGYDTVTVGKKKDDGTYEKKMFNSVDYIITNSVYNNNTSIKGFSSNITLPTYTITYKEAGNSFADEYTMVIVDPKIKGTQRWNDVKKSIKNNSSAARSLHIPFQLTEEEKKLGLKQTLDYGYAITTHKSQGSTYTSVIVLENNLEALVDKKGKNLSKELHDLYLRKLQYVAITRASKHVTVYKAATTQQDTTATKKTEAKKKKTKVTKVISQTDLQKSNEQGKEQQQACSTTGTGNSINDILSGLDQILI